MDSVPAPEERPHVGVLTVLAALVLLAFVGLVAWLHHAASRVEDVAEPERALGLVVARSLDLDEGIEAAPAWERWLYEALLGGRQEDLAQAIRWYEELATPSLDCPDLRVELTILEGEAERLQRLRAHVGQWKRCGDPSSSVVALVTAAYLDGELEPGTDARAELAAALPPGWFRDRLALRVATRVGDAELAEGARAGLAARGRTLRARLRVFAVVDALVLVAGLAALVALGAGSGKPDRGVGGPSLARVGSAPLPPSWSGRAGAVVLIRGGALGAVLMTAVYLVPVDGPGREVLRVVVATAGNLAFVPVILMARRRLLKPAGLGVRVGFGLVPSRRGVGPLLTVLLVLLTLGQAGEWALGLVGRALDLSSHWTEWFEPGLAWGSPAVVAITVLDVVVLTPVLEELLFRGLLFATLRRGLGAPSAALASAAVFALAHGYGVLGFASVFWSALLWAWAYERTGSLLPCIAAHAADNLSASLSVLLVLRA
jgi:membrane protease YdiL (CAAX protease family)